MTVSTKNHRPRSYFSYVTEAGTVLAGVFAYLNGKTPQSVSQREGKQRAMDALLAFWKPYALKASDASPQTVREAAQASVTALLRQMQAISDDFGVELPFSQPPPVPWENLLSALTVHLEKPVELRPTTPTIAPHLVVEKGAIGPGQGVEEMIFASDEDLLGDLD